MADYFSHVSILFPAPPDHQQWFHDYVAAHDAAGMHAEDDGAEYVDVTVETKDDKVWIRSDDGTYNEPGLLLMLQRYLQELQPDGCFAFSTAFTCSKPRLDAYGGAGYFVTATDVKALFVRDWAFAQAEKAAKRKKPLKLLNLDT